MLNSMLKYCWNNLFLYYHAWPIQSFYSCNTVIAIHSNTACLQETTDFLKTKRPRVTPGWKPVVHWAVLDLVVWCTSQTLCSAKFRWWLAGQWAAFPTLVQCRGRGGTSLLHFLWMYLVVHGTNRYIDTECSDVKCSREYWYTAWTFVCKTRMFQEVKLGNLLICFI